MDLNLLHTKPGHLIRRCHQIVVGLFLEGCATLGLTPVQYAVLRSLSAMPGIDQNTLAGIAALDRTSISRIILGFERRGLLTRDNDPADARVRRLRLTRSGSALLERAEPIVAASQAAFIAPLDAGQRAAFMAALETLAAAHNHVSRAPMRLAPKPVRGARASTSAPAGRPARRKTVPKPTGG